jgi:hypothetical protein
MISVHKGVLLSSVNKIRNFMISVHKIVMLSSVNKIMHFMIQYITCVLLSSVNKIKVPYFIYWIQQYTFMYWIIKCIILFTELKSTFFSFNDPNSTFFFTLNHKGSVNKIMHFMIQYITCVLLSSVNKIMHFMIQCITCVLLSSVNKIMHFMIQCTVHFYVLNHKVHYFIYWTQKYIFFI